jgi:hypothetical protein
MGVGSPGIPEIHELVEATLSATSISSPIVRTQHVVSRVLLRQFHDPIARSTSEGRRLVCHDVLTGRARRLSAGGVGYIDDFVKIDSEALEKTWNETESELPRALAAAADGTLFDAAALVSVIRDTIALHIARSVPVLAMHTASFEHAYEQRLAALEATSLAAAAFRRSHGLVPAGPEGRGLGAAAILGSSLEQERSGGVFRLMVEYHFDNLKNWFDHCPLELVTPADPNAEFLMGDIPALTINFRTGAAGVHAGVPVGEANTVVLPLGPRLLAALGPTDKFGSVPGKLVDHLNALQVRAATSYVYYRPGAKVGGQVAGWRHPRVAIPRA